MAEFDVQKRLLHWYAILVAASVLVLICSGGLVTIHEAGMAVPDWPNSGYECSSTIAAYQRNAP